MNDKLQDSSSTTAFSDAGGWDVASWLENVEPIFSPGEIEILRQALNFSQPLYAGLSLPTGELINPHIRGVASILASLRVDCDTLAAGILSATADHLDEYEVKLQAAFNPTVAHLVEGMARMS